MGTDNVIPPENSDSFVTAGGKIHYMPHKVEAAVQIICVITSFAGLIMVAYQADEEKDAGTTVSTLMQPKAVGYTFASGTFLCLALLFNAGAHLPCITPLMMGMGYFYFANSIALTHGWRTAKDNNANFDNYDLLMCGACFSLIASIIACIFEISLPGSGKGRDSGCGGAEVTAILFMLIGFCGLFVMWAKLEDDGDFNLQEMSIKAIISILFLADSLMHFDPDITGAAILLGTLTGCEMFVIGIEYEQYDNVDDDKKVALMGCLITSICVAILTIVAVLITALGRNQNSNTRTRAMNRRNSS